MAKTITSKKKRVLEQWMSAVLGDPVTIFLWNSPSDGIRVAEVGVTHDNGGYSWMQSDGEAALVILLTERVLVEWDDVDERNDSMNRLAEALVG